MSSPTTIRISAIALLFALASAPLNFAYGQSPQASPQGQQNGQGTPAASNSNAGNNPNSGPGNNAGQGNTSPASVSGNSPGNGGASQGTTSGGSTQSTQTAGPDEGHNCGGKGHIDNDAPGHQHDDCHAESTSLQGGASAASPKLGGSKVPDVAPGVPVGSSPSAAMNCNSFAEALVPIFGTLTQQEANVVATADTAALITVTCPDMAADPDARQAVAENPGLVSALAAQGHGLDEVITVEVSDSVPTIYIEAATP